MCARGVAVSIPGAATRAAAIARSTGTIAVCGSRGFSPVQAARGRMPHEDAST
jgi:hypothetical protein